MENSKLKWNVLMNINEKACSAINVCKSDGGKILDIPLTLDELYMIANLSGNEANIVKRTFKEKV